ncbi:MAG: GAF domain-containing protein, partial [Anaerolineae bacterium]|nr:GAF domain-containing protein [Anaerolineae bacterium]
MLSRIKRLFAPPVFDDEEKTRVARLLYAALATIAAAMVVFIPVLAILNPETAGPTLLFGLALAATILGLRYFMGRGYLTAATAIFLSVMLIAFTGNNVLFSGIRSSSASAYFLVIILAGLLLGGRGAFVFTFLSLLAAVVLYYVEFSGLLLAPLEPRGDFTDLVVFSIPLAVGGLLVRHAMQALITALVRARRDERAQAEANRELEEVRALLEERVAERTRDLERRSAHLRATVEVGRAAASILDPEELMWEIATLIQDRFALYHVGIFQIDPTGRWALYRAGAGESGRLLAEQGFRLEVGGGSMIGWCTARAQPRVAQDVRVEAERVDRPEVAQTRSEAALPLIARGQVIGALSVQSDQTGWFDRDTAAALETVADQVAVALDNARLFAESQRALEAAQRAYGEAGRRAWADLVRLRGEWGYSYSGGAALPVEGSWQPEMMEAAQTGQRVAGAALSAGAETASEGAETAPLLAVPLRVRDQVVGAVGFYKADGNEDWTAEEAGLMETLVGQLGVALESAQLFEETQRRAGRERLIGEVTARVRETLDV